MLTQNVITPIDPDMWIMIRVQIFFILHQQQDQLNGKDFHTYECFFVRMITRL